jgi:peptidoglycan/xylan/chitin deacetylase (PgdA/CDA1 family)
MKLAHLGVLSTGTVIVVGLALIVPAFMGNGTEANRETSILLSFDILGNDNVSGWCSDLTSVLARHQIKAAVFMSGKTAQSNPECVTSFPSSVDIGSRTYSYVDLTKTDYATALEQVRNGKIALDETGKINSRLFKAPYSSTDQNIYSLLSRSGILADFSYASQYNKFEDGQFVKYNLTSFAGDNDGQEQFFALISNPSSVTTPVTVNFDSSMQMENIDKFISRLESLHEDRIHVVSASDLAGIDLREGEPA